jgi:hypothetical protein
MFVWTLDSVIDAIFLAVMAALLLAMGGLALAARVEDWLRRRRK